MTLTELVEMAHANAKAHGWWDGENHNIPEKLALIHSEVSEALEDYRKGSMITHFVAPDAKPEGFAIEIADIVIRIGDLCGYLGIDLQRAVQTKHDYNLTRPYRHGGKKA